MNPDLFVAEQFAAERPNRLAWQKPKQGRPGTQDYRWFTRSAGGLWREDAKDKEACKLVREFLAQLINQIPEEIGEDISEERVKRILELLKRLLKVK